MVQRRILGCWPPLILPDSTPARHCNDLFISAIRHYACKKIYLFAPLAKRHKISITRGRSPALSQQRIQVPIASVNQQLSRLQTPRDPCHWSVTNLHHRNWHITRYVYGRVSLYCQVNCCYGEVLISKANEGNKLYSSYCNTFAVTWDTEISYN